MTVNVINAKRKVALLKQLFIYLELSAAAALLPKLAKYYLRMAKIGIFSSHLWSDLTDVLQWLKSHRSHWKPFVVIQCANITSDSKLFAILNEILPFKKQIFIKFN